MRDGKTVRADTLKTPIWLLGGVIKCTGQDVRQYDCPEGSTTCSQAWIRKEPPDSWHADPPPDTDLHHRTCSSNSDAHSQTVRCRGSPPCPGARVSARVRVRAQRDHHMRPHRPKREAAYPCRQDERGLAKLAGHVISREVKEDVPHCLEARDAWFGWYEGSGSSDRASDRGSDRGSDRASGDGCG